MLRLEVNDSLGNILGYEYVMPEDKTYKTDILIDETEEDINQLKEGMVKHNIYYKDGCIVKRQVNPHDVKLQNINRKVMEIKDLVEKEHTIFMDNMLCGMEMEESLNITKKNRAKLQELLTERQNICETQEKETFTYYAEWNRKNEKGLSWKYYSSVCLLIRDENKYLKEWIDWHLERGFDHIYIYDNGTKEQVSEIVTGDIANKVSIIEWQGPFQNVQQDAYNHFLECYGKETRWVNFIDSDEFIQFQDGTMKANDFLAKYEEYTVVYGALNEFNANGKESYENLPVTERFTEPTNIKGGLYHKDFIQPHRIDFMDRHYPRFGTRGNYTFRDQSDNKELFVINHYYTKSWEEWKQKIARGSSDPKCLKHMNEFFLYNPDMAYLKEVDETQEYRN